MWGLGGFGTTCVYEHRRLIPYDFLHIADIVAGRKRFENIVFMHASCSTMVRTTNDQERDREREREMLQHMKASPTPPQTLLQSS